MRLVEVYFNRVERRMAPFSRELSGLILPHNHFGSHLDTQGRTMDEELKKVNFKYAGETLSEIWEQGFTSNPSKLDRNSNVSYMGLLRQCLPRAGLVPDEAKRIESRNSIDKPDFYFADHYQVANWATSVGMQHFAPLFIHNLINGRRLVTLDALALEKLGSKNMALNLNMENAIRDLSYHLLRDSETYETLPYFTTQALNLGRWPPQRFHRQLFQFTDPWLTENYNFLDVSANDLCLRLKHVDPPRHYINTRSM